MADEKPHVSVPPGGTPPAELAIGTITIPPRLGDGAAGAGGVVEGGETPVFVVDLLGVG